MPKPQGKLLIVSGPSGVGKGTLLRQVFAQCDLPLVLSVSATTRKPRLGEIDGKHYHFLSEEAFEQKRLAGEFLECFEVFGKGVWYGTLQSDVDTGMAEGKWVVLEIDVQGAMTVKKRFPDALLFFVEPENMEVLRRRLRGRGTESDEAMQRRLAVATEELEHASEFEYRIVNDDLDTATREFINLLENI